KAPAVRCPQLVKPVAVAQSALPLAGLQGTGRQCWPAVQFASAVQLVPVGEPLHLRAKVSTGLFRQKPQNTLGSSGRLSIATFEMVPVSSLKATARVPMLSDVGGGQSWLDGKSPSTGEAPGVHARPSFGPPLHVFVVGSQIGHDWMKVRHLAPVPGQSALVM